METAHELCVAVVAEWDRRGEALGARTLESFYGLSVLLPRLPAGPQLGRSVAVWLEDADGEPPFLPSASLAGLAVVGENEPRALRQANWPDEHVEPIATVIDLAGNALAEAEAVRARLVGPEPPSLEDAEYHSYEAFHWRQTLEHLQRARGDNNRSRTVLARLAAVELVLRSWSEQKQEEAEDLAAQRAADDWPPDDDEYEEADPRAFDIEEVLRDL